LDKPTNALFWGRKPAAFTKLIELTVVPPPLTNTAVLAKLGFDPRTMPMKPMSVEQCVSEGLNALRENRSRIVPGRLNRFMDAFVPACQPSASNAIE
jgi:uncharacterized protein